MATESNIPVPEPESRDKEHERTNVGPSVSSGVTAHSAAPNSRVEVSAQTIARMMGVASSSDLQLLEGRLDLLASRVSTLMIKVDKVLASTSVLASAGDIGRIETQLASIKAIVREFSESVTAAQTNKKSGEKESVAAQSRILKLGIQTSSEEK